MHEDDYDAAYDCNNCGGEIGLFNICEDCGFLNRKETMATDTRRAPSYHHIEYMKARAKAYSNNKTEAGKKSAADAMDSYLRTFKNLEQYDPRRAGEVAMATTDSKANYIEIKQGGLTFRKSGGNLTITCNQTMEYNDLNLLNFNRTLASGLEVIAAASKFDEAKPVAGVSI